MVEENKEVKTEKKAPAKKAPAKKATAKPATEKKVTTKKPVAKKAKKVAAVAGGKEALAQGRLIRISPRKLNLVAGLIRGLKVDRALTELGFSKKRVSGDVKKVLQSAIANAENNYNLDVDRLYVSEAYVGKAITMKRFHARAKGRGNQIKKMFSNITIIVREFEEKN